MTTHYGKLQAFRPGEEELSAYLERVELFFAVNETPAEKQVPIFLNAFGANTYGLLRNLVASANPKDKSLAELMAALKGHFEPKRNKVAERFHFHRRNQKPGESVAEYVAELRRLAATCAFEAYLNDALRDRIVCGLRSEATQKRLLMEGDIDLARTVEIARSMETAHKDAQSLKSNAADLAVGKITEASKRTSGSKNAESPSKTCYRCSKTGHVGRECKH